MFSHSFAEINDILIKKKEMWIWQKI